MRISNRIVLATTNNGKMNEFKELLSNYGDFELVSAKSVISNADKLKFAEKNDSYLENSLLKARIANQACHFPCLADDSGLEIQALEEKPGVRSARYAIAKAGVKQDKANLEKVLEEMKDVPANKRAARFVCAISLVMEGMAIHTEGVLDGRIIENPTGDGGFGYDPIFIPDGQKKTLAELGPEIKNQLSHRAIALKALFEEIEKRGIIFAKP